LGISISWLLHQAILIAYQKDLLKEGLKWLGKRPILFPTFMVFLIPVTTAYLTLHQIPEFLKLVLPLLTFIAGQFLGRYEKQSEIKNKQIEILLILKRKLSITREKFYLNKSLLRLELDLINSSNRGFIERRLQFIDRINEDFTRLDTFLMLTSENVIAVDDILKIRKLSSLIDEFNELIEERKDYRLKCRELASNSVDHYFSLLEFTDRELLRLIESFEQDMHEISKLELSCDRSFRSPVGLTLETPTERVKDFREWVSQLPKTSPSLPDEAFSRDSIYEE